MTARANKDAGLRLTSEPAVLAGAAEHVRQHLRQREVQVRRFRLQSLDERLGDAEQNGDIATGKRARFPESKGVDFFAIEEANANTRRRF